MTAVAEIFEDTFDAIGDVFESVGDVVEDVVDSIGDAIEKVGDVVEAIIDDPIPTLLSIGGQMIGIPAPLTMGAITAARGGDLEDIALSMGTAYLAPQVGSAIAGTVSSTFIQAGLNETFSQVAADSISKGLVNGTVSELRGGSFEDGFAGGFTGGMVAAGVNEVANYVKPNVIALAQESGVDLKNANAIFKAGTQALSAGITSKIAGGDFETAFTNSAIGSTIDAGKRSLSSTIDQQFRTASTAAVDDYLGSIDPDPYGANYGEDFDYLAAVGEPANPSLYPPQDFGVPVSMDTPFYASKDAALSAGATAYSANPNGTFTYTYDDGSKVTIDSSSNVVDYIPSNDILRATPDQQNLQAERDLEQKLSALNIAQRLAPTAVNALLEKNRPTTNPYGSYGTAGALGALSASTNAPASEDMRHLVARVGKPKDETEFSSFLAPFFSKADVQTPFLNVEDSGVLPDNNNRTETASMQPYFNYGSESPIDQILNFGGDQKVDPNENLFVASGGAISPLMGTGTRYGRYALGGMATPLMAAGGKPRVDFRKGDAVTGPGDGQSDDIPAMLADGEFVFPADVVAAIGNGSTKAGSDKLYDMMHGIRKHARSAKPKDLPPEIKSPLDFLKS